MKDWQSEALDLHQLGLSGREIARRLGKGKTTVNDLIARLYADIEKPGIIKFGNAETKSKEGPRILVYDIETAPIIAHVWKLWDNNVGLNQIENDWHIMSFAAKWLGEDEIFYYDQRDAVDPEDDSYILSHLWGLLNKADFVIGHNVKKFDTKKVNARFILNGFPKPTPYRQIDTMTIARDTFGFTSNKLAYLSAALCPEQVKNKHDKYPGHEMWVECMKGNRDAWETMEVYNKDDILATEAVYNKLCSWDSKLPNFDVYVDGILDMTKWVHEGEFAYSNMAKYKLYRNIETGQVRRSRFNELSKEKKQSLLANVGY